MVKMDKLDFISKETHHKSMYMKWLAVLVVFLIPLFLFSQKEHLYQNEIGIHNTQTYSGGPGVSLRYRRQLSDKGIAKFEFNTNNRNTFFFRIGYEPFLLNWKKIELGLGVDLKFEISDYNFIHL